AVVFIHHHDVTHADRIGKGQLNTSKDVGQRGLHGKRRYHGNKTRRGQQTSTERTNLWERQQNRSNGNDDDDRAHHTFNELHLRLDAPPAAVFCGGFFVAELNSALHHIHNSQG